MSAQTAPKHSQRAGLQRSTTRSKVNVVSKASLALLNPAYAMGIDSAWTEEDETAWRSHNNASQPSHGTTAMPTAGLYDHDHTFSPTPELAAFKMDVASTDAAADAWGSAFGVMAPEMQRKTSGGSVFEDDELGELKEAVGRSTRRIGAATAHGSNGRALSRLFTWKRSNKATKSPHVSISSPRWETPSSAPAHVTTFEQAGYALPPAAPMDAAMLGSNSVPSTPLDAFITPSPDKPVTPILRNLNRKSSMPSLRGARQVTCSPLTLQQPYSSAPRTRSIYWQDGYGEEDDAGQGQQARMPSQTASSSIPAHARIGGRSSSRISSVGKGARKSSYDSIMPSSTSSASIVLTPEAQEQPAPRRSPRKKSKRFEPWGAPNVPPLPSLAELQSAHERKATENREEDSFDSAASVRATRRRSKSVDAISRPPAAFVGLPSLFTPEGLFDTSIEEEQSEPANANRALNCFVGQSRPYDRDEAEITLAGRQAQRVNLANRPVVIGVSSPKLVNFSPRLVQMSPSPLSPLSRQEKRGSGTSSRLAAPVVVNVMPPTPDLSAQEHAMFDGELASPGVRRSLEMSNVYFDAQRSAMVEKKEDGSEVDVTALDVIANSLSTSIANLPQTYDKQSVSSEPRAEGVGHAARQRTQSTVSDFSDFDSSAASESGASATYEPFGFARSLSMMSLSSESETSDDGNASDSSDEVGSVEQARIVSVSSSISSFSKAQLVSPRAGSLGSPRCPAKGTPKENIASSFSTVSSLQSPQSGKSAPQSSASSHSSKRNSARFGSMPSLTSGQSLASVMTTSTSILDFGSETHHGMNKRTSKQIGKSGSDLRAPVEIQSILDSMGVSVGDEDDCDTPRLSDGFNAPMASIQPTRPLNVRKTTNETAKEIASPPNRTTQLSPKSAAQTSSTPGLSPTPMRPYPRAQNSSSPHLELDLSLPLDLHGIGLGFEIDDDKPKRRGKNSKPNARPKVPTKSRQRHSVQQQAERQSQKLNAADVQQPKTPPVSGRLLASAMEGDSAMGLGLDLGLEGFTQEVERVRNLAPSQADPKQRCALDADTSAVDAVRQSKEEHQLLGKASSNSQRVNAMLRSSKALRSASSDAPRYLRSTPTDVRPSSSDSNCSTSTVRPSFHQQETPQHGEVGFAL